jgi:hypothetical protein
LLVNNLQDCCKPSMIFFFHRMMFHYFLLTNASSPSMFLWATWTFFTNVFATSTTPLALMPNYFVINVWSMVIFSLQTTTQIHPSSLNSQVCKNSSNRSNLNEQQTSHPNQLTKPIIVLWIPSRSTTTFSKFPSL